MRKLEHSFIWLFFPFLVLMLLGASMINERSGIDYKIRYPPMQYLPVTQTVRNDQQNHLHSKTLVIYDSKFVFGEEHIDTVFDTLDSMRVTYEPFDISSNETFDVDDYDAIIISLFDLQTIETEILGIMSWVREGGRVLFSIRPDPSDTLRAIYRDLGIISIGEALATFKGIKFTDDILPGGENINMQGEFLEHSSHPISLDQKANIHAVSLDEFAMPLIWSYDSGNGRIVFINSDQFNTKSNRGIIAASYSELFDVFAYPVINASVFFIDDFPSPIPEGSNELIKDQYGRDIQSFLINVWWPDIESIADQFDIYYTGVMIETYNDELIPPFSKQPEIERHKYFGGLVLNLGGEIGLHGYNHVPLCLTEENVNQQLDYPGWPSTETMQLSVLELYTFAKQMFPDNDLITYVPPSNVLCDNSRKWLAKVLPELRVISSVYLEDEEGYEYKQEFMEAEDGIIELPRIISGYEITEFMRWAAINELGLHYINSHFAHPDDVISVDRGALSGWENLKTSFSNYVGWLYGAAPGIRNMTAKEAGMAVQRFYRMNIDSEFDGQSYIVEIDNFYDEAWFMLQSKTVPHSIEGGTLSQISKDHFLVKALEPIVKVHIAE